MSLKEKLEAARQASAGRIPPEKRAVMQRVIAELRSPSVMSKVVGVGQPAPAFALASHDGRHVDSNSLLSRGPLVLSFFRGAW